MPHPALSPGIVAGDRQVAASQRADWRPGWNTAAAPGQDEPDSTGRASGLRDAPTLIRAKVNPEPDGMHREQRGDGRPAHGLCSAWPRCCRPDSRSRAQQRVQPGQRGHNAGRQFQAQQRGRKPAEPARDAGGHHRSVADGQPGAHALRYSRSPHPPAADNQLRERIPAGAEPENDQSDRALHRIAPSSTPVTSTLSPKLPGTKSPESRRQRPGTTKYRPTDAGSTTRQDHGLIFASEVDTPIDPDNFSHSFSRLCERAGLGHWHLHEHR